LEPFYSRRGVLVTTATIWTQKFEKWYAEAKAKDLQYVNVYYASGINKNNVNYESFCKEFMEMKEAPNVPDRELI